MRHHGSGAELERRRRLAVKRVLSGYSQVEVAKFLGVTTRSVARWMKAYRDNGNAGLDAKPQPGRPRKLTPKQEHEVLGWIVRSPTDFGFPTELWTAPRVAALIEKKFGITFHARYINHWLALRRITPQKPTQQARERDEEEILRWVEKEWPRIKKMLGVRVLTWF